MIFLLYGGEDFLISKKIKSIIKDNHIDDYNITKYDLTDTLIEDVLADAETMSLFETNKLIIVNNSLIFTGVTSTLEHNLDRLLEYLNNPNENTILIFIIDGTKLDERKKIVKIIKQKHNVVELSCNNINSVIKDMFGKYKIDNNDIRFLIDRVGSNLELLSNEIEKIKTYKDEDYYITKEEIINLTHKNIDADIFQLVNAITSKNVRKAIEIYHEMLKYNEEPIKIIVTLANQLRIIYQTKELYKKGYTEKDITEILKIHPYRIQLALKSSYQYDSKELLNYLYQLADLDIAIKSGKVDKELAFELFILKLH